MSVTCASGVQTPVTDQLVNPGAGYAPPWSVALGLAGPPLWQSVLFGAHGPRELELFAGALAAVEPPSGGNRVWWPVIDAAGAAKPVTAIDDLDAATMHRPGW